MTTDPKRSDERSLPGDIEEWAYFSGAARRTDEFAAVDNGLCSCGHDVLDHGFIEDGNGWEASPCRLCNCLDSDWGEPSLSFKEEARKALGRALDGDLLRSEGTDG